MKMKREKRRENRRRGGRKMRGLISLTKEGRGACCVHLRMIRSLTLEARGMEQKEDEEGGAGRVWRRQEEGVEG